MKTRIIVSLALVLALMLSCAALADYSFDASVVCVEPAYVTADIGGTVGSVPVRAGQMVASGDELAALNTAKVYAALDGDVTGIFCAPGDSVSAVTDRYGALMVIEPDSKYKLTASTDYAYNASANKYIHVGEAVYLMSSDGTYTGEGFVTSVSGTDFTVEVTSGSFYIGNNVYVYRNASHTTKSRIGRGEIERIGNISVTGSAEGGSVVAVHVSEGDHVRAGDLLLETLSGEYDAYYYSGSSLLSDADGVLASLNLSVGANVAKGDVIATLYPRENLQLKVDVVETDLSALTVGTPVSVSFNWNEDAEDAATITGTVAEVLYDVSSDGMSESSGDTATYAAYIDFGADENVRLGMTAIVYVDDPEADDVAAHEVDDTEIDDAVEDVGDDISRFEGKDDDVSRFEGRNGDASRFEGREDDDVSRFEGTDAD